MQPEEEELDEEELEELLLEDELDEEEEVEEIITNGTQAAVLNSPVTWSWQMG